MQTNLETSMGFDRQTDTSLTGPITTVSLCELQTSGHY